MMLEVEKSFMGQESFFNNTMPLALDLKELKYSLSLVKSWYLSSLSVAVRVSMKIWRLLFSLSARSKILTVLDGTDRLFMFHAVTVKSWSCVVTYTPRILSC